MGRVGYHEWYKGTVRFSWPIAQNEISVGFNLGVRRDFPPKKGECNKLRRSVRVWINKFSAHKRCLLSHERILPSMTGSSIGKLSPSPPYSSTQTSHWETRGYQAHWYPLVFCYPSICARSTVCLLSRATVWVQWQRTVRNSVVGFDAHM